MRIVRRGPAQGRLVALTFDDGPDPLNTPAILAALRRFGAKATFFVLGTAAAAYPRLVRLIAAEGHEVAVHGYYHDDLRLVPPATVVGDLRRASELIGLLSGRRPQCFRPPYGALNAEVVRAAASLGLKTVLWGEAHNPSDWSQPGVSHIVSRVLARSRPGMIVPLHDGGGDRAQTAAALPLILEGLQRRGLRCVSVSTLLHAAAGPIRPHAPVSRRPVRPRRLRRRHRAIAYRRRLKHRGPVKYRGSVRRGRSGIRRRRPGLRGPRRSGKRKGTP